MLVLTRKRHESITLDLGDGRTIEVVVSEISHQVKLGIIAPLSVKVHRSDKVTDPRQRYRELGERSRASRERIA